MRLLLDTHVFYWWNREPESIAAATLELIKDPDIEVLVSAASVYEITYKRRLGKLSWPGEVQPLIAANQFTALAITAAHSELAGDLPLHHRDPFDRLLIAQAVVDRLTLATRDAAIRAYDIATVTA